MSKLLIIGSIPPPVGGVTIHVQRLLNLLEKKNISYSFCDAHKENLIIILFKILKYSIIHLHISNIYVSLLISLYCFILRKRLIITRHGNIGRNSGFKKIIDVFGLSLSYIPILLNSGSYEIMIKYNSRAKLISAFLPPEKIQSIPNFVLNRLKEAKTLYRFIFATCASDLTFTHDGKEIYGVFDLLRVFESHSDLLLVVVTRSTSYENFLKTNNILIPSNVLFLSEAIDFYSFLHYCDGMIRNTCTDGDSISVREALFLKKQVLASDCVKRPDGVSEYHSISELEELLNSFSGIDMKINDNPNSQEQLLEIYNDLILH